MSNFKITSSAFENNSNIPSKYTCDGENTNPPLGISGVDQNTESIVLIMDDPDATTGIWDHWVTFNLDPELTEIKEGSEPEGIKGANSWGSLGYGGPCPSYGEHRYVFKLYTLDTKLNLKQGSSKKEVGEAMEGHILQEAKLIGLYEKMKK